MTRPNRTASHLPLSFGPDAVCFRLDGGRKTYELPWIVIATTITGREAYRYCTVHQLKNGKIGVSVDELPTMKVYTQAEFAEFCVNHGKLVGTPTN